VPMTNLVEIGFTDSRVVCDLVGTRLAIPLAILVRCHGEDYPQFCYPMSRKTSNAVPTILSRGDFILCAMDIKEIRKQNFAALFADFERRQREANAKATLVEFGKQYALNHRHVSQIKNGSRRAGWMFSTGRECPRTRLRSSLSKLCSPSTGSSPLRL
jgi:hypothetical protein